ncbi:substrate binding domain-containing protein [Serratia marcescens]
MRTLHGQLQGPLRLTAPMAFSIRYLAPLLSAFMEQYPNLNLDVEYSDRLANLNQENFDVAIRIGALADSDLIAQRICANRHLICASPTYLARQGTPTHPQHLQQHQGLLYIHREPTGMLQLPIEGEIRSFRIGKRLRTDNAFHLLAAAKAGLGLAILPAFIAADAIRAGELRIVLAAYSPDGGDISAVYRRSKRASPKIKALVDFLSEHIGPTPSWETALSPFLTST